MVAIDRYEQAGTYYQLGKVAEALGEVDEAIANYLLDLEITAEFNDQHGLGISLRNLNRFYQAHPSPQFLTQVAQCLGSRGIENGELRIGIGLWGRRSIVTSVDVLPLRPTADVD